MQSGVEVDTQGDSFFIAFARAKDALAAAQDGPNAFAERFVRTIRQECLDHILIYGRRHLERVLRTYVSHYSEERPHRSLDLIPPLGRPGILRPGPAAHVRRRDILGGLIHEYRWAA